MNKIGIAGLFVGIIAIAGAAFAFSRIQSLEQKVVDLETDLVEARTSKAAPTANDTSSKAEGDNIVIASLSASEKEALMREIMAEVDARLEDLPIASAAGPGGASGTAGGGGVIQIEGNQPIQVQQLAEQVRQQMDAEREAERAKEREEWANRARDGAVSRLEEELGLSPAQSDQVGQILTGMGDKMRKLWENNDGMSRDERREGMRTVMDETQGEIKMILSTDQSQKFDTLMEESDGWGLMGGGRGFGGGRGGRGGGR